MTELTGAKLEIFLHSVLDILADKLADRLKEKPQEAKTSEAKFLSRKETAEMIGVSLPTLDKIAEDNIIERHKVRGRILFDKGEVLEAIKNNKTQKWRRR